MRTTLDIADDVLLAAKELARRQKKPLGEVISELARQAFAAPEATITPFTDALMGNALGDTRRFGLDGAAVAAFLGLLWPRLNAREPVALALACGLVTALAIPWVPAGVPILLAAALGAFWGWVRPSEAEQ